MNYYYVVFFTASEPIFLRIFWTDFGLILENFGLHLDILFDPILSIFMYKARYLMCQEMGWGTNPNIAHFPPDCLVKWTFSNERK